MNQKVLMQVGECRDAYLNRVVRWCRKQYTERRQTERHHPSHTADDVMEQAERVFPDLGTCGVEGWCSEDDRNGVSYLNAGDTYEQTIFFFSNTERFRVACFDDVARSQERQRR